MLAEDTRRFPPEVKLPQPASKPKPAPQLPLSNRLVRVKLLLSSYLDACEAPSGENENFVSGGNHENGSRQPIRNEELWYAGSYRDVERGLDALRGWCVATYNATWSRHVIGKRDEKTATKAAIGVEWLSDRMASSVYVPQEIAENAGYLESEAKEYTRPRKRAA